MKKFTAKLFLLFLTFFVGVTAYYVYYPSPDPVEEAQYTQEVSDLASKQVLSNLEEKPRESNFYYISPCDEVNSFKKYLVRARGTISGGVVNHKVVCGDLPEQIQNSSDFSATVTVYVLIDQFGEVEDARIMNGHRLLNKSFLSAARHTRFSPYILGGEPVKVRGVLIYSLDNEGKVGFQKMKLR